MANEYFVNRDDLVGVAGAIREKGGTGEPLVFPAGFVTAIQGIKGGADLNFEIIGGTTKPTNPKPNTIWINTNVNIAGWSFSVEEPENPAPGMLWLVIAESGPIKLNAITENAIDVYLVEARQYVSGAFERVGVMVYQDGEWLSTVLHIVKNGVLQDVGFTTLFPQNTVSQQNGYVRLEVIGNYIGIFTLTKPVNFKTFRNIHVSVSSGASFVRSGVCPVLCVGKTRPTASSNSSTAITGITAFTQMLSSGTGQTDSFSGEFDLPIDDGIDFYVGFIITSTTFGNAYMNVTDFYIE